jgi:GT2 family glycosyltransferase
MPRQPLTASILLLTYKAAGTVVAALDGALAQTVPCELIVSDDCSPDDTFEVIRRHLEGYAGPHRITLRRGEKNLGVCGHQSEVMALATGDVFVVMAGDDVARPDRVALTLDAFAAHPDVYILGSAVDEIDGEGKRLRRGVQAMPPSFDLAFYARVGKLASVLGAAMSIRREVFERFGPIEALVEDNILSLRAALLGRGLTLPEALVAYRQHASSLSSWVYARSDREADRFRRRYERTVRMYRDTADDLERCIAKVAELSPGRLAQARAIVEMYRIEADAREAILTRPRREWLGPIWRGLRHPGLRRKSAERALKLVLPRRWFGLKG